MESSSSSPPSRSGSDYYETSLSPSPAGEPIPSKYYYLSQVEQKSSLVPQNEPSRKVSASCKMDCCPPMPIIGERGMYMTKFDDYLMFPEEEDMQLALELNPYAGYTGKNTSILSYFPSLDNE